MDVYHHIGSLDVLHDSVSRLLGHCAVRITWEDSVHIEVEVGNSSLYGVDAQRVEGRVDFERAVEGFDIFAGDACQFVAHHLPFQFITVRTCDDTEA